MTCFQYVNWFSNFEMLMQIDPDRANTFPTPPVVGARQLNHNASSTTKYKYTF